MREILESIFKGLLQWIYEQILEIVEYVSNDLLDVFSMDLSYFKAAIPAVDEILNIIIAAGWALLLGNLIFQTAKSMMSGLGFEAEDPKTLFARTFVFGFLLLASRQICDIGLGISNTVITMLQIPDSISVNIPGEDIFSIGASWLLMIIAGLILMWQLVKLFFVVGERYFLVGLLTVLAPWAFAMGGSRNTADIFKGWARMFASMCLMMVMNVIFLKMFLSVMGNMPSGTGVVPWIIFCVAISRVARKIDGVIVRIGLNPAQTGAQGRGLPGLLSYMVIKSVASNVVKTAGGGAAGKSNVSPAHNQKASGPAYAGSGGFTKRSSASNTSRGTKTGTSHKQTSGAESTVSTHTSARSSSTCAAGTARVASGAPSNSGKGSRQPPNPAAATTAASSAAAGKTLTGATPHISPSAAVSQLPGIKTNPPQTSVGGTTFQKQSTTRNDSSRRSSVTKTSNARSSIFGSGTPTAPAQKGTGSTHPPITRSGNAENRPVTGTVPTAPRGTTGTTHPSRYSPATSATYGFQDKINAFGAAGTARVPNIQQGRANVDARGNTNANANLSNSWNEAHSASNRDITVQSAPGTQMPPRSPAYPSATDATGTRKTSVPAEKPKGAAGTGISGAASVPSTPRAAGTETRRSQIPAPGLAAKAPPGPPEGGRSQAPQQQDARTAIGNTSQARQEHGQPRNTSASAATRQPSRGAAGMPPQSLNAPYPVTKPDMTGTRQASSAAKNSMRTGKTKGITRKTKAMHNKKHRKGKGD